MTAAVELRDEDTHAIVVEGVGKRYRQYRDEAMLLKRLVRPFASRRHHDLWALRDVDLEVARGETLGIIGRNGSGKTTLLRLLSGVSAPTVGMLRVVGRRAPLIGVGVGFNAELTGRENVEINGRLLGMTPDEVRVRFDDIVAFSELESFIDVPVKFYSSGMFLRLAFSIAIHVEPEVMLVDEILAVGDVAFQTKCFERMSQLQDAGTTIVVVTHNLQVLQRLTPRTVVLDRGRKLHDGDTEDALRVYHEVMARDDAERRDIGPGPPDVRSGREPPRTATVEAHVVGADGEPTAQVRSHEPLRVRVRVEFAAPCHSPVVGLAVERAGLGLLFATGSRPGAYGGSHGPGRPLDAEFVLDDVPLLAGTFSVQATVQGAAHDQPIGVSPPARFHVSSDRPGAGTVDFAPRVTIEGTDVPIHNPQLKRV